MQWLAEDPTTSPGHLGDATLSEAATRWPRPRLQGASLNSQSTVIGGWKLSCPASTPGAFHPQI